MALSQVISLCGKENCCEDCCSGIDEGIGENLDIPFSSITCKRFCENKEPVDCFKEEGGDQDDLNACLAGQAFINENNPVVSVNISDGVSVQLCCSVVQDNKGEVLFEEEVNQCLALLPIEPTISPSLNPTLFIPTLSPTANPVPQELLDGEEDDFLIAPEVYGALAFSLVLLIGVLSYAQYKLKQEIEKVRIQNRCPSV